MTPYQIFEAPEGVILIKSGKVNQDTQEGQGKAMIWKRFWEDVLGWIFSNKLKQAIESFTPEKSHWSALGT